MPSFKTPCPWGSVQQEGRRVKTGEYYPASALPQNKAGGAEMGGWPLRDSDERNGTSLAQRGGAEGQGRRATAKMASSMAHS